MTRSHCSGCFSISSLLPCLMPWKPQGSRWASYDHGLLIACMLLESSLYLAPRSVVGKRSVVQLRVSVLVYAQSLEPKTKPTNTRTDRRRRSHLIYRAKEPTSIRLQIRYTLRLTQISNGLTLSLAASVTHLRVGTYNNPLQSSGTRGVAIVSVSCPTAASQAAFGVSGMQARTCYTTVGSHSQVCNRSSE